MEELIKKSSLYDMLSMIVPGFITLFFLAEKGWMTRYFDKCDDLTIAYYICIFALSYLFGLLIHHISKWLFDPCLRNNPKEIRNVEIRFKQWKGEPSIWHELRVTILTILCIVPSVIKPIFCFSRHFDEKDKKTLNDYYKKYYEVIRCSSAVPTMEAQVSFIRSMLTVFLFIIISLLIKDSCCCCCCLRIRCDAIFFVSLLSFILVWVMVRIQNSIYRCIFEDYYYLHREGK